MQANVGNITPINRKFIEYLMSSCLYYEEDAHVLSDYQYDVLCKELLEGWDDVDHYHKHLITKEDLQAGTGYAIKYPLIVVGAARLWHRQCVKSRETK